MNKPVLLVLAAGLGSRYGGLKQLEPVGKHGQLIIDYSLYDAKRAGFEEVIFVIRPEMQAAFEETIGARVGSGLKISYAFQEVTDIPEDCTMPEGRTKPWGTAHAVLSARHLISGSFATINADDFYGSSSFQKLYQFLATHPDTDTHYSYGLVGYALKNTVTEHGTVSRGVCTVDDKGHLSRIDERTHIEKGENCPRFTLDDGNNWEDLSPDAYVSMNLWGFSRSYIDKAYQAFSVFLRTLVDPLTSEYYLPAVADTLVNMSQAQVTILPSDEKWYGITYPEDRDSVVSAIESLTNQGVYPENLWT